MKTVPDVTGMTIEEAALALMDAGFKARLRVVNGKAQYGDAMFSDTRINLEVENAIETEIEGRRPKYSQGKVIKQYVG